jgi:hypothetical protein
VRGKALLTLVLVAAACRPGVALVRERTLMRDDFRSAYGPNGLITNQFAFWAPEAPGVRSPLWEVTSGSLFSREGHGWTGVPDAAVPNAFSTNGTGSLVFRLRTRWTDFGSVRQEVSVRVNALTPTSAGGEPWDGVVLWPRYESEFALYFAYVLRRDGRVQLTKKCAGQVPGGDYHNGGTYFPLTAYGVSGPPLELGAWTRLATEVHDEPDGAVTVRAFRDGRVVARAVDRGTGCAPLHGPARLGVRGDNADFDLDDYRVAALR